MKTETMPTHAIAETDQKQAINPWSFVPLLYFMQLIPVVLVQDVSSTIYKSLGVENELITRWTSLVAVPWSLHLLLGPIVDLNSTKRKWTLRGQLLIACALMLVPLVFQMPNAFELSLGVFFFTAIFSTLCNIATDGYYLLTMSREQQAKFAGVLTTFARLGNLFCQFLLLFVAGWLAEHGMARPGVLVDGHQVPSHQAWGIVLAAAALIYFGGWAINSRVLPVPIEDVPATENPVETRKNVARTLLVVGMAVAAYFAFNAGWRLLLNWVAGAWPGDRPAVIFGRHWIFNFEGWVLKGSPRYLSFDVPLNPVQAEWVQLLVCAALAVIAFAAAKRTIVGTETGEAFLSYFRQSKIVPILLFLMFYRFGEAMVVKMAPLFLQDSVTKGGMGMTVEQIGIVKGVVGIVGIIAGGLLGGWVVSKFGLRRTFWTLAILMHLPNLLYLWAASTHPPIWTIYGVHFAEQFGYGFGFAGYMIYQMFVAQRGHYRTTHYAIGVGLGALFIQIAGISSGIVQANYGYQGFFFAAIFAAIPGLLTLLFIPLEDNASAPQGT